MAKKKPRKRKGYQVAELRIQSPGLMGWQQRLDVWEWLMDEAHRFRCEPHTLTDGKFKASFNNY